MDIGSGIAFILLSYLVLILFMFGLHFVTNMRTAKTEQQKAKVKKQELKYNITKLKTEINGIEYYTRMFNMWALAGTEFDKLSAGLKTIELAIEQLERPSCHLNPDVDGKSEEEYCLINDYLDDKVRESEHLLKMAGKIANNIGPESHKDTHVIRIMNNKDKSKVSPSTTEIIDYYAKKYSPEAEKAKKVRDEKKINEIRKQHAEIAIQKAQLRADRLGLSDDDGITLLTKRLQSVDIDKDPDAAPLLADIIFDATKLFAKEEKELINIMPDFNAAIIQEIREKRQAEEERQKQIKKESGLPEDMQDAIDEAFLEVSRNLGITINPDEFNDTNTNALDTGDE